MTAAIEAFRALHVPGRPLVLYNIWDPGSAKAVAAAGRPRWQRAAMAWPRPLARAMARSCLLPT